MAASLHAQSLKAMRAVPAAELKNATGQGLSFLGPLLGVVVDGWVLPKQPFAVFAAGQEHRADLLLGSNARELMRPFFPVKGLSEGISDQYGPLASRAFQVYGVKEGAEGTPDPVYGNSMAQWATDSQFRCGTVAELVWHSRAGNVSYEFQFSRVPAGRENVGAAHGSDCRTSSELFRLRGGQRTRRDTTMRMRLFRTRCSNTGRISRRGGTLTTACCRRGRSSIRQRVPIWI